MTALTNLTTVTEQGHDTAGAIALAVLVAVCLLWWAAAEGLMRRDLRDLRARHRAEAERDDLAESLGVVRDSNPYMRPWRDRRPGDLGDGGAA